MSKTSTLRAKNNTASTILTGKIVYATDFDSDTLLTLIDVADNRTASTMPAIGVVCEDADPGDENIIVRTSGPCAGFDTIGVAINAKAYVGQSGNVIFSKPHESNDTWLTQQIGTVLTQDEYPYGQIQVLPQDIEQKISHNQLKDVTDDQHHVNNHAWRHDVNGPDPVTNLINSSSVNGTGASSEVAYWGENNTLTSDPNFNWTSTGLGIGTTVIPHGAIGAAKFAIEGTDGSTDGPHVQFTTPTDDYPVFQQLNWGHDNIALSFDCYYDANWRSSDVGSNFQIYKTGDKLSFRYDSVIAAGDGITWNEGITLDTSGNVGIGTVAPGHNLSVFEDNDAASTTIGIDNLDQRLILSAYYESGVGQYATIQSTNNTESGWLHLALQPSGGNVGIGTTAPLTTLHVKHATNNEGITLQGDTSNNRFIMMNTNMTAGKGSMILNTASTVDGLIVQAGNDAGTFVRNVATFLNDGNVGIGTTAPEGKLEISTPTDIGTQAVTIDQNDADKSFIDFQGTTGANATSTISTHGTPGALTGFLQIEVNGAKFWIPYYADPSA